MALVMALGISMVLAIAGASLVLYSVTNEHHAKRSRSDLRGYNIAQTGIENAVSQIAAAIDADGDGAIDYDDPTIFSALPPASKTETFGSGEQVVWDAQLWDDRPNPSVLYAPSGNPVLHPQPALARRVHLDRAEPRRLRRDDHAASRVRRPARAREGPAGQLGRVALHLLEGARRRPPWRPGDNYNPADCEIILPNNPNVAASFYVTGDLCLENNSQIIGSGGSRLRPT